MIKISDLRKDKKKNKLVMLTCYDFTFASLFEKEKENIDMILVGDSLANVIKGEDSTVKTTLEDIIYHTKAVRKGAPSIFTVADMPFMSYQISVEEAVRNAGRLISEAGANAVKLEGGRDFSEHVKAITRAGIPVMGHLGLTHQWINVFGSYNVRGKSSDESDKIREDAKILQECGAFSIVLECVPEKLASNISQDLEIPTIGIGAGKEVDGQVLVLQDMLGMNDNKFKFLRKYSQIGEITRNAIKEYSKDVKEKSFPSKKESF
ncbi:MAG: 3-methyl-2-oxobutanoate hydroxymethyltransferase [Candidatus Muiribacterium halophilum]|uniref:3-methyl-2-oxobutanoate hydroxymethyltransferase n=1 Tax=Muiribacterium halophilum TaxID=2053465 RepID=A0A2N5ZHC5_MUIH1|nr:MAG: 3-methyl-2-oxobutanoate hydroxymethyltransferase [Candidatus Muirbacterium halophilum]